MIRIKEILKEKGLTQNELADKLGVTRDAIAKMLVGNPTISYLERVATALDVHVLDLFEDDREYTEHKNVIECPHCHEPINIEIK